MRHTKRLLALGLVLLTQACSAGDFAPGEGSSGADGGSVVDRALLQVDPIASETVFASAAISGTGPANGQLLYQGADGRSHSVALSSAGSFCEDVALAQGDNEIVFRAISPEGHYSSPVTVRVLRSGEPPPSGGQDETDRYFHDAAAGMTDFDFDLEVFSGQYLSALTDNDPESYVHFGDPRSNTGWLSIPLDTRGPLHAVRLLSASDCPLKHFKVFVSDLGTTPVQRGQSGFATEWTEVAYVDHPDAATAPTDFTVTLDNPALAQHVGIEFFGWDLCTPGIYGLNTGRHKVHAIEAWIELEEDGNELGEGGAPSCQNGF